MTVGNSNGSIDKTSFLSNFRIGCRIGMLALLALMGFAGLGGTYL